MKYENSNLLTIGGNCVRIDSQQSGFGVAKDVIFKFVQIQENIE